MLKLLAIIAIGVVYTASHYGQWSAPSNISSAQVAQVLSNPEVSKAVQQAFVEHASNVSVEAEGVVAKVLADDNQGARHQRFIVKLDNGISLLIAHNIDLAPRIENLNAGDNIAFKGEYVWNAKGGIVHWTHHDPSGHHAAGWLKHNGKTYE
jgi:Protein of unknown function (DUF3465)